MSAVALGRLLARRVAEEGEDAGGPVTLEDVRRRLVPYRLCRGELDLATKAEYDLALLGLLSEPELVRVLDEALREAVSRELASAEPELSVLRDFDTSLVELGPELGGARAAPLPEAPAAGPGPEEETAPEPAAEPPRAAEDGACRACGAGLPDGREVRFCPHCGTDQRPPRCGSCGEELETDWSYCPACGRAVEPGAARE